MNKDISNIREKINQIDREISNFLNKRYSLSKEIAHSKKKLDEISRPARELEIVENLSNAFPGLPREYITNLYKAVFSYSRAAQESEILDNRIPSLSELIRHRPVMIAGPCAVESREQILSLAEILAGSGVRLLRGGAFKPRTSPKSFQGLGLKGLEYIREAADNNGMYIVNEALDSNQADMVIDQIDILQIGSRNMSSYGFLKYAGKKAAARNMPVILKRGFSATIGEFLNSAEYLRDAGVEDIILCLRGIRTFEQIGSELRFTPDIASIAELKRKTELPVIFDPSHSTGKAEYIEPISKAAIAAGAGGLMIEIHESPADALSDGRQALTPGEFLRLKQSLVF